MSPPLVPSPNELRQAAEAATEAGDDHQTEWEVAFHEAGHVVVEVATGSYPDEVFLNDDALVTDHAGRTSSRSFYGVEHMYSGDEDVAALIRLVRQRYAAVLAAGHLAGDLARGYRLDHYDTVSGLMFADDAETTDGAKLRALVCDMAPEQAETWLEDAFTEAERLLRERWSDVRRVAAALVEHRRLSRDDLFELLLHDH